MDVRWGLAMMASAALLLTSRVFGGDAAQTISQSTQIDVEVGPYTGAFPFIGFDDFGGQRELTGATLSFSGEASLAFEIENGAPFPAPNVLLILEGIGSARIGMNAAEIEFENFTIPPAPLEATDGINASGGDFWNGFLQDSASGSYEFENDRLDQLRQGQAVDVNVFLNPTVGDFGLTQGVVSIHDFRFAGDVTLEYEFDCTELCTADVMPVVRAGVYGNGLVNVDDLIAIINGFGMGELRFDINPRNPDCTLGDGQVGIDDLIAVINAFGSCPND
ncbi:MAG: hypothetical protein AAF432_08695 [Planctomycetota bacterium]